MEIRNYEMPTVQTSETTGSDVREEPKEIIRYVAGKSGGILGNEKADREEFWKQLCSMTEDELRVYVPDVYQKSIYRINYVKLKEKGIKLLSFDVDDTINDCLLDNIEGKVPFLNVKMPKDAIHLVQELKEMGFIVILMTNASVGIGEGAYESLNADGYISKANKPETASFERTLEKYHLEKNQMAHIGNSMRDDIVGGNRAGVTTCLVRRNGFAFKLYKTTLNKGLKLSTRGQLIVKKLEEKGMWHKHHARIKGDQYYQIDEVQRYSPKFKKYEKIEK